MIPFCNGHPALTSILGQNTDSAILNDDLAWHLKTTPTPVESWPMRLLPAFVRTPLKARLAERQYEQTLIAMWENSPHLLDDIGVVLSTKGVLPEDLVAAPARVVEHVQARILETAAQPQLDPLPAAPAPAPAARTRARRSPSFMPAGLPA